MAFALADLVQETSTAPGTGNVQLNGAIAGRRSFVAAIGDGNATYYILSDGTQAEWGEATVHDATPDFITRDLVIGNTAGTTAKLNFTTTTKVYGGIPVERLPYIDNAGQLHNIPAGSIATAMIADAALTTTKYADASITAAKLAPGVGLPPGATTSYAGATAPTGWLLCDGDTIGSATSGAIARANADTVDLFTVLWNSWSNTLLPIQTSGGVPTTRGVDAAGDFAANKRLPLPDTRGRVLAGKDNMGGTAANRLTAGAGGVDGTTLGAAGGADTQTLTTNQIPVHSHPVSDPGHEHVTGEADSGGGSYYGMTGPHGATTGPSDRDALTGGLVSGNSYLTSPDATGVTVGNAGGGAAHPIVQPTMVMSTIIKL